MARVLVARPGSTWQRVGKAAVTALAIGAQLALGLVVLALRTVRVIVTLTVATTSAAEQQLADRIGRPALSHTGIAAIVRAFATEFYAAYRAPAR